MFPFIYILLGKERNFLLKDTWKIQLIAHTRRKRRKIIFIIAQSFGHTVCAKLPQKVFSCYKSLKGSCLCRPTEIIVELEKNMWVTMGQIRNPRSCSTGLRGLVASAPLRRILIINKLNEVMWYGKTVWSYFQWQMHEMEMANARI